MGYVDQIIQPGETILATGRMHWIVYWKGALLVLLGLIALGFLGSSPAIVGIIAGALLVIGLAVLAQEAIAAWTTEIVVTNKRVIHKRGLIWRATAEMNMDKVESVIVEQSLMARLLGYGTVVVRGTGSGMEGLHYIADPLKLRSTIVVR